MKGPAKTSFFTVLRQLSPMVALCALFASVGIVHVASRVMVVKAGYRLSKLESKVRTQVHENDRLKLELATLKSPGRLERAAKALGMGPPSPGTIIQARRPALSAREAASRRAEPDA